MNIPENVLQTLTEEQRKRVEAAQSPEELLAIAKEVGYELSETQLQSISGGSGVEPSCKYIKCPKAQLW